jgi:D-beta-D-heptose 7-phosphate kinase / D-beta-D-heptose 1-phosphate adenosyltransferase
VLGIALASGADYGAAIQLANIAGGLEVEKIGVATVTRDEMLHDIMQPTHTNVVSNKVLALEALVREVEYRRRLGQRVVFTNGCFDVLHAGHVQYLQEARSQGDMLIVGLNSDASVRTLKGKTRPVQPLSARSLVLAGLQAVDFVTVFEETTPMHLIQALRPDVLVKGSDYSKDEVVGSQFVEACGGRVHLATLHQGHSTTNIIDRMRAA